MIYRPADRTEASGQGRTARELAAVLVALALFLAFILQFACAGADPIGDRWLCPNNARLARIGAHTPTAAATPAETAGAGVAIWTAQPDVATPGVAPLDDFGAPELPFAATPGAPVDPFAPATIAAPFARPTFAPAPTPLDAFVAPATEDRAAAILGTATALSATATARVAGADASATPDGPVLGTDDPFATPEPTPTSEDGGYP